jgi:site-specific recombinase XerD
MRRWDRLLDSYMEEYAARGVSKESVAMSTGRLERWGRWLKARRPRVSIERIDADSITRYIESCSTFKAKATVYGTLSTMRGFGDYLVRQGLWTINPLRWMKGPKVTPYSRLPKRIDREHMEALWREAAHRGGEYSSHLWVTVLAMLYGTGLRRGELERLNLDCFDRAEGTLRIDGRKTGRERCVPLPEERQGPQSACNAVRADVERDPVRPLHERSPSRLLTEPKQDTVIGLRDRALLALLCGSGIRASEAASLRCRQVDLVRLTICVCGKGGHERSIPLNPQLGLVMQQYERARGASSPSAPYFRSRFGGPLSRGSIYERVRTWGQRSRVGIPISPHRLRHTFATHLVRAGVGLVTIRDLLGHRQITSTQIYLHVTAEDLRSAAARHPIGSLLSTVKHLLPTGRLPFQRLRPFASSA